jgi:L-glutamine-phosphate cytidylyltransferase
MRLFVLAAGQGKRLEPETIDRPKCLVPLDDGSTFLSRLIHIAARTQYIDEVFVITGHCSQKVEQMVRTSNLPLETHTLYNPFYEVAGPLVSLWIAHERMEDQSFLVCNGDTLYTQRPFDALWTPKRETIRLCVDPGSRPQEDDMKVQLDDQGNLVAVGKTLPPSATHVLSTGLVMVKGPEMRRRFTGAIRDLVRRSENVQKWQAWHEVLNKLAHEGISVETLAVDGADWTEVDTLGELEELRQRMSGSGPSPQGGASLGPHR